MKSKLIILLFCIPLLSSCDDMFEPALENIYDENMMHSQPTFAQGILGQAYALLPYTTAPQSDLATDDAVSNDINNSYLKMATGSWASNSDPLSRWKRHYYAIQNINLVLKHIDQITWAEDESANKMFYMHYKGECYAMRALHTFFLLQTHAGKSNSGELLGVPLHLEVEDASSDFNKPRDSYQKCVEQVLADMNQAMELLPLDFGDVSSVNEIPEKYIQEGANVESYNRAFGQHMKGRISNRIIEAVRTQLLLMAASPAFSEGSGITWENVADNAAIVLDRIGGISGMDTDGWTWYTNVNEIANLSAGDNPQEILWRGRISDNNTREADNYPPSIYGKGRVNPTQNLVDAFPMANGYPIDDPRGFFDSTQPYENRDPRLKTYVLVNGETQGVKNSVIITGVYGDNLDRLNGENGKSTRTGYYLRKQLRSDINLTPNSTSTQKHYTAFIRYTEIFLAYAEAANEAWGPLGKGTHNYSAYDVIKAIRSRAGVGVMNGDPYLEEAKNNKDKMRELIRNERRLELCFENFRFWDLRRWKVGLEKLNETAEGIEIQKVEGAVSLVYLPFDAEERRYKDYMYYGPIPYSETQKYNNLEQNAGW